MQRLLSLILVSGALFAPLVLANEIQDASALLKQGKHSEAMDKVSTVLARKPRDMHTDAQARFLKGLIQADQGNKEDAIRTFTDLTSDYPDLPEPYNNLAVLYAERGEYDKAKTALESAIRTHPSYATAHENLGDIYAKMASQAYDRALQLDKSNTATQTKLALIGDLFTRAPSRRNNKTATETAPVVVAEAKPAPAPAVPVAPVVATPPAAASKPAPVVTPKVAATDVDSEVLKATQAWAAAWSARNSKRYLAFYGKEFTPPGGENRSTWEATRTERITNPKSIQVDILTPHVKAADGQHAEIHFRQNYRANHFKASSLKTLAWVKSGDQWFIVDERSGN